VESRNDLQKLQDNASQAYANLLDAQGRGESEKIINELEETHDYYMDQLKFAEEKLAEHKLSTDLIYSQLFQQPREKKALTCGAKAKYTFSIEESEEISDHYEKLPENLQALFNAALLDSTISMDTIENPVFLNGEGYVYNATFIQETLTGSRDALYPTNNERKFTQAEVIPCNTLIVAMKYLQDIIRNKPYIQEPIHQNNFLQPTEQERAMEYYYLYVMEAKHRILFDKICRDSMTQMIMRKPVFLPDGYAYDMQTALTLLESAQGEAATCPGSNILFTKEDITPCHIAINVLDQLKENIATFMQQKAMAQNNQNQLNNRPGQ
jgi:hypothetical protein